MSLKSQFRLNLRLFRNQISSVGIPKENSFFKAISASSLSQLDHPRFAILISKKIFPQAVDRNLLRRRLQSIIETSVVPRSLPLDHLIIPKKSIVQLDFNQLATALIDILCLLPSIKK